MKFDIYVFMSSEWSITKKCSITRHHVLLSASQSFTLVLADAFKGLFFQVCGEVFSGQAPMAAAQSHSRTGDGGDATS